MKILIIFIFSLLLVGKIHAQDTTPNKIDSKNLRQGLWTIYYTKDWKETTTKDSIIFYSVGEMKDNQWNNVCIDYNAKTKFKKNEINYFNGKANGITIYYDDNGKVNSKGKFLDDKKEGLWTWYYLSSKIKEEVTFVNGKREGKYKEFSENGTLAYQVNYVDNIKQISEWEKLNKEAFALEIAGKYKEAIAVGTTAKAIAEKEFGKNSFNYTTSLNNLGGVYTMQGIYDKAETFYLESLSIRENIYGKKHENYANTLSDLANLYIFKGNFVKAETFLMEALNIRKEILGENTYDYSVSVSSLANLYEKQGNYQKAESFWIQTVNICKQVLGENDNKYAKALNNLANNYLSQKKYQKVEELLLQSLNIRKKNLGENHPDYAISVNNLANLYHNQLNYPKAEVLYLETLRIDATNIGKEHPNYAISLNNLGNLYFDQKKYTQAIPYFVDALSIFKKTLGENHISYALTLNSLGALYQEQKNHVKASSYYQQESNVWITQIENNIANLSEKEKELFLNTFSDNFNNFNAFVAQANKEIPSLTAWAFNNSLTTKGLIFSNTQKIKERIQQSNDKNLQKLYENWKDTRTKYAKALQMSLEDRKKADISTEKLQITANELEKALSLKSELFAKANDKTKYTWKDVQKQLKVGEMLVEISRFEQKKEIETFFIGKGLRFGTSEDYCTIVEIVSKKSPAHKAGLKINDKIISINGVDTKGKKLEELGKMFAAKECKLSVLLENDKTDLVTIKADSVFTTKTIYEPSYMALIITPTTQNQPEMVVLPNGTELEIDAVTYYKNNIKFKKEDKASYNAFWADIKAKLGAAKKVYFVPDGVYHQVNLLTLQNPATKAYLKSETEIQLLSSSKDLIKYAENAKKQRKNFKDYQIHLFGYPAYAQKNDKITSTKEERSLSFSAKMDTTQRFFNPNSGTITILEGTKTEINNISKILSDKKIKVTNYLENQADEKTIKTLKNADIVHIATHGFFLGDTEGFNKENADKFRENPLLRSGLLLKDAEKGLRGEIKEGEDGVLTAQEALNLNLDDTELVVMSACETGLGEIKNGEGVYGLQRSFQQAGAKTILMSLWKVDDNATQELMTSFYTNLSLGKTKRQAFDDAQETLYKKYKNPYFWGAFVMVGE